MGKVLFAYEFGASLGHLNRLVAVAKRLASDHQLCFALPGAKLKVAHIRRGLGDDIRVTEGVSWKAHMSDAGQNKVPEGPREQISFADPLNLYNFQDAAILRRAVQRWTDVIEAQKPDLVVADFAPSARLAFQGCVPMVVVGSGYTVMPPGRPFPPLFPWQRHVSARSRGLESRMLAAANDIRAELGGPSVDHLGDLFQGDETFVCTFTDFDPYMTYRSVPPMPPFNLPDIPTGPPIEDRQGPVVAVYMPAEHRSLANVLRALSSLDLRPHVYVSGVDFRRVAAFCGSNVVIHTVPYNFAEILPQTRLLVHHAGLGSTHAGLVAGTPQLVLPHHAETLITARGLVSTGGSVSLDSQALTVDEIRLAILSSLQDEELGRAAIKASERLAASKIEDSAALIATACLRLLTA